jgi:phosphoadenosine phosphosulfate reductase
MTPLDDIFDRHERIALQLSGGKDSLAVVALLRPYWPRLVVYLLNTGDAFPETIEAVSRVRAEVPNFVEIDGRQRQVVAQFGIPSDIVPASHTYDGLMVSGKQGPLIQDRYSCCVRTIMRPMAERMQRDGITLVIRGQRADDKLKAPIRSGHVENGIEYLFPIEDWTADDVLTYLREQGIPVPRFYTMLNHAPDCMTCSGWWEEGAAKYLKAHHPAQHAIVQQRLDAINTAVSEHIAAFNIEVNT